MGPRRCEPEGGALQLPRSSAVILLAIVGCVLVWSFVGSCLSTAGVGALVAWIAGWDVSRAAWLGFFATLLWNIALVVYGLVRGALFVLQVRLHMARGGDSGRT